MGGGQRQNPTHSVTETPRASPRGSLRPHIHTQGTDNTKKETRQEPGARVHAVALDKPRWRRKTGPACARLGRRGALSAAQGDNVGRVCPTRPGYRIRGRDPAPGPVPPPRGLLFSSTQDPARPGDPDRVQDPAGPRTPVQLSDLDRAWNPARTRTPPDPAEPRRTPPDPDAPRRTPPNPDAP